MSAFDHQSDNLPATLVCVENLVFNTVGSWRSIMPPERVAEYALRIFQMDYLEGREEICASHATNQYCDFEPLGMAVRIAANRVLIIYHALGETAAAKEYLLTHELVQADGTLGTYALPRSKRRAV